MRRMFERPGATRWASLARGALGNCAMAIAVALVLSPAHAQSYPAKPVRLIVPYAPGGAGDVIARIVSQRLGDALGQPVIVENRPGAGGMIGAMAVASAPADGYTVLLGNTTEMVVGPYLSRNASYETQRDFKPVAIAGMLPQLLIANPSLGVRTLPEFVALAKAKPGAYSYATAGTGSTAHIAGALLERLADVKLLSVPYKGGAQAVADVLAGNVNIYFSGIPPAIPHVRTGRLIALGVAQPKPVTSLPDVPPLASGAMQRLDMTAWFGFFVPSNTPPDVVATLHSKLRAILDSSEVSARLVDVGVEPASMSAAEFEAFVANERRKYQGFLADLGIKGE